MGKLAEIKTKETNSSVENFINAVPDEEKRKDSFQLCKLMGKATKDKPKIWGSSIIGFGNKRFKSPKTEREVEWFKMGFSPRKDNFSLYLFLDQQKRDVYLKKLGKYKTDGGCIYVKKLSDIDLEVLEEMITTSAKSK